MEKKPFFNAPFGTISTSLSVRLRQVFSHKLFPILHQICKASQNILDEWLKYVYNTLSITYWNLDLSDVVIGRAQLGQGTLFLIVGNVHFFHRFYLFI